jgi:hypothetical protein
MMAKKFILWICCLIGYYLSGAQVSVDQDQLSKAIKEKLMDEITEQITSSVEKGEQWVANETYFSVILEPFKPFGIDPGNPNFLNQAYAIHQKIKEKLEKEPDLKFSSQLKSEIKDLVKNGLWNYASSFIDDDSKEIYKEVSGLLSDGQDKIKELLEAAEGISSIDSGDENYESKVTAILKKYGIKSNYFYIINDLDQVLSKGWEKIEEPLKALSIISAAAESDDPTYKIEMLLELGESYGGKIPVIGQLITPIFKLGKGVFNAARGLEGVLEKNLNQGCISPAGGTYASTIKNKRSEFIRKFPDVDRACPVNQEVFSLVYNNIYVNTSHSDDIFFYLNDVWYRGKRDNHHLGVDDIFSTIQWLRRKEHIDKATELDFIFEAYQKEYGWAVYTKEVTSRVQKIKTLFMSAYQSVNHCDSEPLKDFFMGKMGLSWISRLLNSGGTEFEWEDMINFNSLWEKEILDQMIQNYYLSQHQNNLNRLDEIIQNLTRNIPVNVYGTVTEDDGRPVSSARLEPGSGAMFVTGNSCQQVTTSGSGSFSYFITIPLDQTINLPVTATMPDNRSVGENVEINPVKSRFYKVNLRAPRIESGASNLNNEATENHHELSGADCGNDPLATPGWDSINKVVICTCANNYIWNESLKKCEPDIQKILANSDCSKYPNTQALWDYTNNEPYCDCLPGFAWNKDYTACIDLKNQQLANADCSGYPNTQPVWNENSQSVVCNCLPGYKWNKDNTACIPEWEDALKNYDCSRYPNTEPVWDPVAREVFCNCIAGYRWKDDFSGCIPDPNAAARNYDCSPYPNTQVVFDPTANQFVCDCLPGFQWNKQRTGCVPERNKPNIDWNAILNFTMNILNAANQNNQGTISPGNIGQNQQPVMHQSNCNDQQQAGGDAPEVHYINLGQSMGTFTFDYNVYSVKDQIIITQGGATIFNSGCVSGSNSLSLNLTGFGNQITVQVHPNCEGNTTDTKWDFTVHCPRNQ